MKRYIVINESEILGVFEEEEEAREFAEEKRDKSIESAKEEYDYSDEQIGEAAWQAGFDGGVFSVVEIDTEDFDEDGEMTVYCEGVGDVDISKEDFERAIKDNDADTDD